MAQRKNLAISFTVSAIFLLASASISADYSQTQNKINNEENSPKQSQPHASTKKKDEENKQEQNSSDKRDISTDGPRGDAVEKTPHEVDPARTDNHKSNYK